MSTRLPGLATVARTLWSRARSVPFTWVIVIAVTAISITRFALGVPARRGLDAIISSGFDSVVLEHHWVSAVASIFIASGPIEIVAIAILLALAERNLGTKRTIITYLVVGLVGTAVGITIQAIGIQAGDLWSETLRSHRVVDALLPLGGTVMAASFFTGPLLRRRIRVLGFAALFMFLLYSGQPVDLYRILAAAAGLALGRLLARGSWRPRLVRSSQREARSLLAAVVAITAIGPVITMVSPVSFGPLKPLGLLLKHALVQETDTAYVCGPGDAPRSCLDGSMLARLDGFGPVLLTILPLVALLVAAYGILLGRRIGLWLAIAINLLLALLAAIYYGVFPRIATSQYYVYSDGHVDEHNMLLALAVLVPLALAVWLFSARKLFPSDFRGDEAGIFFARVAAVFVVTSIAYLIVAWIARAQFVPVVTITDLLLDLPERFIPVGFLSYERIEIEPQGPIALIAYLWVGPFFWVSVITLAIAGMRRALIAGTTGAAARIHALLRAGAGGSLSWIATWPGHHYWFADDADVAVAYRVISGVALATGEPIGPEDRKPAAIREFADFCTNHGWTPVFYSVSDDVRPALEALNWSLLPIAEETVLRPGSWSIEGKKMQDVRTAVNRAGRAGIRAEWTRFSELSASHVAQIRAISEAWVSEKDLPELGFTLGGFDELRAPEVAIMIAVDGDDRLEAVTSWLPTFEDGVIVGWTLDVMRRRSDAMPGIMEFIIAQSVLRARDDGIAFMSLSGAPLAHSEVPSDGAAIRLLGFLSRALEPVYGFASLLRFKKKFRPELRPLYLAYPDPLALPGIGRAVARAYAPTLSTRAALKLLR